MNKEKTKHLPFNLFWYILPNIFTYFIIYTYTDNIVLASFLTLKFYLIDVYQGVKDDYFEEEIKSTIK